MLPWVWFFPTRSMVKTHKPCLHTWKVAAHYKAGVNTGVTRYCRKCLEEQGTLPIFNDTTEASLFT